MNQITQHAPSSHASTEYPGMEVKAQSADAEEENMNHHRRASSFFEIGGSVFNEYEYLLAIIWLVYTICYWTLLTWIPILIKFSFSVNLYGFIIWCFGAIGMFSTGYAISQHSYPSGATKDDRFEVKSIGRWCAAVLTTIIIIDCFVLVYVSIDFDDIDAADNIIYNTNLSRLILHIIHIFWASLFFINRFIKSHKAMAITAFILEWTNIIWTCSVSFIITNPKSVDILYFLIVGILLIGWMGPMMFNTKWGTRKYAQNVSIHLLLLDLSTNAPIIITILITQSYKNNTILFIDVIWKSFLLQRSVSTFLVKHVIKFIDNRSDDNDNNDVDVMDKEQETSTIYGVNVKLITYIWLLIVFLYWTICVLSRCIIDNEITLNYQYYTWFFGIIGIFGVLNACLSGYHGNTKCGQSFIAFTCLSITIDCTLHAYHLLAGLDDKEDIVGEFIMVFHCIALISSVIFYRESFKKRGIAYSLIIQWIDIILMFIVIEILHNYYQNRLIGGCFSKSLCSGYFAIFIIKIIFSFVPIIFIYANHERYIHIHMVLLVTFTDLPLIAIIVLTTGYNVHSFVFIDIVFKVIVLLISYSYHLVINILFIECGTNSQQNQN